MASFLDNEQQKWTIVFDALLLADVRSKLKVDLTAEGGKDFDRVSEDIELLVNLLWHLLEVELDAAGIDQRGFAKRLVGEAIERAVDCLREAVNNFLPPSRKKVFLTGVEENAALREVARARIIAKVTNPALKEQFLEAMEADMDRRAQEALTRLRNVSSGPEQSESAPKA